MSDIEERIRAIQKYLGVDADGLIGPATLTAIEAAVFKDRAIPKAVSSQRSLSVSTKGLKALVHHEISSQAYYKKKLEKPCWPGGASGVTIGIGYDLGQNSKAQFIKDWGDHLSTADIQALSAAIKVSGEAAKAICKNLSHIKIPLKKAEAVFYTATLPRFASLTLKAYPGVNRLFPDAQAAVLSLVYNRGVRKAGDTRKEMKALERHVKDKNYSAMADAIRSMKRLWEGKNLPGLLRRRDDEAEMILKSDRNYNDSELVNV